MDQTKQTEPVKDTQLVYPEDATPEDKLKIAEERYTELQSFNTKQINNLKEEFGGKFGELSNSNKALMEKIEGFTKPTEPEIKPPEAPQPLRARPTVFNYEDLSDPNSESSRWMAEKDQYETAYRDYQQNVLDYKSKLLDQRAQKVDDFLSNQAKEQEYSQVKTQAVSSLMKVDGVDATEANDVINTFADTSKWTPEMYVIANRAIKNAQIAPETKNKFEEIEDQPPPISGAGESVPQKNLNKLMTGMLKQ